jgi:hypothetical protein
MGFPKGAIASLLVKGGVKTPSAKWLRSFVKAQLMLCDGELSDQSLLRTDSFFLCSGNFAVSFANF